MSTELKQILLEIKVVKLELAQTRRDLEDIGSGEWLKISDQMDVIAEEISELREAIDKLNAQ